MSDGLGCFPGVTEADCTHTPIPTGGGAPSEGHPIFWWINTMLGNVKNAMHGTYHALRPKYLQRYLSEFCYRFVHSLFGTAVASTWLPGCHDSLSRLRGHHPSAIGS